MPHPDDEMRIIIRVKVTDLPGDPLRRHTTLGELFSKHVLLRPIKPRITPDGYDGLVIPPNFDSEKPISRWFIYDLNVKGRKTAEELLAMPHKVYLACKNNENWTFVPRDMWVETARERCQSFMWGGKAEQRWLEEMRNSTTMESTGEAIVDTIE